MYKDFFAMSQTEDFGYLGNWFTRDCLTDSTGLNVFFRYSRNLDVLFDTFIRCPLDGTGFVKNGIVNLVFDPFKTRNKRVLAIKVSPPSNVEIYSGHVAFFSHGYTFEVNELLLPCGMAGIRRFVVSCRNSLIFIYKFDIVCVCVVR